MHRLSLLALTLALTMAGSSLPVRAQSGRGGGYARNGAQRVSAHLHWLGGQLGLTTSQRTKLKPILMREWQQMNAVRRDAAIPKAQKMDRVDAIHESFRPQINAVLTPEQQEKYQQLEKEALAKRQAKASAVESKPEPRKPADSESDD